MFKKIKIDKLLVKSVKNEKKIEVIVIINKSGNITTEIIQK